MSQPKLNLSVSSDISGTIAPSGILTPSVNITGKTLVGSVKTSSVISGSITPFVKLTGNKLKGSIEVLSGISGSVNSCASVAGSVTIDTVYHEVIERYEGDYEITPSKEVQIIESKDKVMLDDITIHSIPYAEVTNTANGVTVTIG